jgi:putative DNA primase/helicase
MAVKGIGDILNKLQKAKQLGNGEYQACCPAHEDKKQSLSLKQAGDKILINCFAGCQPDLIMNKIGLSLSDLYIKSESAPAREPTPQIVKTYSYPDEDGKELYQVVRMFPKSFRQRHMNGGGEWSWNMDGVRRVLYRLPEVLAATGTVYLVEGEKDADNLCAAGLVATTSPAGANNWRPEYAQYLQDKKVVIIPDKDRAGYKYAQTAIESLKEKASSLGVILLPGDDVKDVSDWLEQGGDPQALATMEQPIDCLSSFVDNQSHVETLESKSEHHHLTDIGNAERLMDKYGNMIRYNYDRKMWLTWNGDCWNWDTGGEVMQLAQKTARSIYSEITMDDDEDTVKAKRKWAVQSESNQRLVAMIEQAQPLAKITLDQLDHDIWLLNCKNGTVNLQTGVLQAHNPEDYITRVISTSYNPDAISEEWTKFLKRTFGDKDDLIAFVQRALGYSITGSQGEQAIFFCHGEGWNGKSTLLGACRLILQEYAAEVEPATFMIDRNRGTGPNEAIASLYNVNFVTSTEIEEGQRLSTSLLKRMTGGESLRCERKFEHGFNFKPRYKLWMSGNHEPEISDTTRSIKNRFHKIAFLFTISALERVQHYDEILATKHGEAILAWLVKGTLEWQHVGLGESSEVKEATQSYFDGQDILHDFLAECCLIQPTAKCIKAELYVAYEKWCDENGDRYSLGKKTFNSRIAEKGFVSDRGGHNKPIWCGLRLLTAEERENVTSVTNVTQNTQSMYHEENGKKDSGKTVTNVDKVTSSDVKAPKRLLFIDSCPDCGSENIGVWPDGSAGFYCLDCFPTFNQEAN